MIAKNRRTSIEQMDYHTSFTALKNFYPTPQGSIRKRDGVKHIKSINGNVRSYFHFKSENITLYTIAGDSKLHIEDSTGVVNSVDTLGEIGLIFEARILKNKDDIRKILVSAQYRSFLYDLTIKTIQPIADHPYKTYSPTDTYNKGDLVVLDNFNHVDQVNIPLTHYMGADLIDGSYVFQTEAQSNGTMSVKEYSGSNRDKVEKFKKLTTTTPESHVGNFDLSNIFSGISRGLYRKRIDGVKPLINTDLTFKEHKETSYPQRLQIETVASDGSVYPLGTNEGLKNSSGETLKLIQHNYTANPLDINSDEWELVDGACLSSGGATWFKDQIVFIDKNHLKCGTRTHDNEMTPQNIFDITVPVPTVPPTIPKDHEPKDYELMTKDYQPFKWILSGEILMMGTASEEYIWQDTSTFPRKISMVGGSVSTLYKDTVFIASRDARKLYKYFYSQEAMSYQAQQIIPDLNRIIKGRIIKLAVKREGDEGLYILTDIGELYVAIEINGRYALAEVELIDPVQDITEAEGEIYITTNSNEKSDIYIITGNNYDELPTGQAPIKAYLKTTAFEMPLENGSTLRRVKKLNGVYVETLNSKGGKISVDGDTQPITYLLEPIRIDSETDKALEVEIIHEDIHNFELLCLTVDMEV